MDHKKSNPLKIHKITFIDVGKQTEGVKWGRIWTCPRSFDTMAEGPTQVWSQGQREEAGGKLTSRIKNPEEGGWHISSSAYSELICSIICTKSPK